MSDFISESLRRFEKEDTLLLRLRTVCQNYGHYKNMVRFIRIQAVKLPASFDDLICRVTNLIILKNGKGQIKKVLFDK